MVLAIGTSNQDTVPRETKDQGAAVYIQLCASIYPSGNEKTDPPQGPPERLCFGQEGCRQRWAWLLEPNHVAQAQIPHWATYLASLCLSFVICKDKDNITYLIYCPTVRVG